MGQSQRTSRSPVITCCIQTGTEKTEVECGWQEGHQRSHEKTLGVETSRSSVAPTVAKKRRRRLRQEPRRILLARNCRKRHQGYGSSRAARGSVVHSSRATACGASAPTCDLYFWFSWRPTLTQVGSPYPYKVGGQPVAGKVVPKPFATREDLSLRMPYLASARDAHLTGHNRRPLQQIP